MDLFVLLQDPKEHRFLTRMRRRFGGEEVEGGSEEELEAEGEESRERRSKAPCSFADDAVLESPSRQDNERYFQGYQGC